MQHVSLEKKIPCKKSKYRLLYLQSIYIYYIPMQSHYFEMSLRLLLISLIFHLTKKVMSKFFCALCRFTTSDVNIRLISIVLRN